MVILDITWYIYVYIYHHGLLALTFHQFKWCTENLAPLLPFTLPHLYFVLKYFLYVFQTTSNSVTISASIIKSLLWNSIRRKMCCSYPYFNFFHCPCPLTDVLRFLNFIFFLFQELPLAIHADDKFPVFYLRMPSFPLPSRRVFLLDIEFVVDSSFL